MQMQLNRDEDYTLVLNVWYGYTSIEERPPTALFTFVTICPHANQERINLVESS